MGDPLTITDDELKTLIAGRLRAMVEGATRANEPVAFVRHWLLTEMEGVRALIEKMHHGATHTLLTSWPQKMGMVEVKEYIKPFLLDNTVESHERLFKNLEEAAAVDELFTQRGV